MNPASLIVSLTDFFFFPLFKCLFHNQLTVEDRNPIVYRLKARNTQFLTIYPVVNPDSCHTFSHPTVYFKFWADKQNTPNTSFLCYGHMYVLINKIILGKKRLYLTHNKRYHLTQALFFFIFGIPLEFQNLYVKHTCKASLVYYFK